MTNRRFDVRGVIIGGGIAGILAGIVMAMAAMFYAAASGSGFLLPVRSIATTWYGENALGGRRGIDRRNGHPPWQLGFLGSDFAALPPRRKSVPAALVGGFVWGAVVWAILAQPYDVRRDSGNGRRLVVHFALDFM